MPLYSSSSMYFEMFDMGNPHFTTSKVRFVSFKPSSLDIFLASSSSKIQNIPDTNMYIVSLFFFF